MSRTLSAAFALSLAFCLPASAQTSDGGGPRNAGSGAEPGATTQTDPKAQPTLTAEDKAFLDQAADFNDPEIHAAILAGDQASASVVKAYSRLANSDHNEIANDLAALAERYRVNLPNPCAQGGDQAINQLKLEHGDSFDRAYMTAHAQDDRDAIDLFEQEARSAGDSEVGQFASQTVELLRQHLRLVQLISNTLNPSASE